MLELAVSVDVDVPQAIAGVCARATDATADPSVAEHVPVAAIHRVGRLQTDDDTGKIGARVASFVDPDVVALDRDFVGALHEHPISIRADDVA